MSKRLLLIMAHPLAQGQPAMDPSLVGEQEKSALAMEHITKLALAAALPVDAHRRICHTTSNDLENDTIQEGFEAVALPAAPDTGSLLQALFAQSLIDGFSPIVLVNSCCPGITPALLEEAFQQLEQHDVVLGPAQAGQFYLLGLNYLVPDFFTQVGWGTQTALASAQEVARQQELTLALLLSLDLVPEQDLSQ
ncbi:DUF2064 domain-containing protein [Rufibacter immobilis]|uniref:DUF2064 domain-containing protein n=1 Tax=Rufibacter immobilis TaxID=1348778 RepID=UPI0035ED643B